MLIPSLKAMSQSTETWQCQGSSCNPRLTSPVKVVSKTSLNTNKAGFGNDFHWTIQISPRLFNLDFTECGKQVTYLHIAIGKEQTPWIESLQKFQQKAPKQTKQKKSKSADFLMVKEDGETTEGIGNPAFNMSSPDLSTHQTSKEKVTRRDMPGHTLTAPLQKFRLQDSAEAKGVTSVLISLTFMLPFSSDLGILQQAPDIPFPHACTASGRLCMRLRGVDMCCHWVQVIHNLMGNECSRNYFDPLMEEEINPWQCAMEVSRQDEKNNEETFDLKALLSSSKSQDTHKKTKETTSAYSEEPKKDAQRDTIMLARSLQEQDMKFERKGLSQDIPLLCLKLDKTLEKASFSEDLDDCMKGDVMEQRSLAELTKESLGTEEACRKGEQSRLPVQVQIICIRGLKDKVPQGSYCLRVSLLDRLGTCVSQWWQTEQMRTHPVHHGGNFYDVGLYFHESLSVVLPQRTDVKPGVSFLFELFILHGMSVYNDLVMGWGVFPVCDNNFCVVEGKFKCPLLRGHYDQTLDSFRKIEDLICQDLDQWLCNLYFKVIKLPPHLNDQKGHESYAQFSPEFPVCLMVEAEKAKLGVESTAGHPEKGPETDSCASADSFVCASQGSISNKMDPCPTDCDLCPFKEAFNLQSSCLNLSSHPVNEKPTVWYPGEHKDHSQDISYLEELEKHRFSVCRSSVADSCGSGELTKHLHFALAALYSELELAQWQSQGFWYIILLMASLWFPRLYLHYLGQWLFLQAVSTPVTKFYLYPYTAELCYPTSSLHAGEELAVLAAGPLGLNTITFALLLIRWGCQLLFSSCPDALSQLITMVGLWTILDPLAVFLVDIFLGRLSHGEETPTADAAKLYWMLISTKQPAVLGVVITVILYILIFIISLLILYLYCLRVHNDFWVLDAFQRIHSDEAKFFVPHDLEISNQELSYIVKRSKQWRGSDGERRKVAVHDYICKNHGTKSSISCRDLQHQSEISLSALGPGGVTSYVSVYTMYPRGFQELYRHFLRLPDGAIIEVFGDISTLKFAPSEVITAIEEQIRETDTVQGEFCAAAQDKR
ncbi:orofacial cleft 1 candidate gene 1 protein [Nannospalax galili]|uniref:orofacial cleft 1 candidate gene 1 protein n=1 Tax=Nannospalax galili TaxID=1026970 RepID=UPI00111C0D9A|nr:orofacial cleft 1 candidate gene 1 protein [Nannospalax galili]